MGAVDAEKLERFVEGERFGNVQRRFRAATNQLVPRPLRIAQPIGEQILHADQSAKIVERLVPDRQPRVPCRQDQLFEGGLLIGEVKPQ